MASFVTEARELLQLEAQQLAEPLSREAQARRRQLLVRVVEQLHARRSGEERRQHLRVPGPLQVRFRTGDASLVARAEEMALGGFSLGEPIWVVAGQHLLIESVRVGSRDYPLQVRARVVWRVATPDRNPSAGLEFAELDDQVRGQIRTIFEALLVAHLRALPEVAAPAS